MEYSIIFWCTDWINILGLPQLSCHKGWWIIKFNFHVRGRDNYRLIHDIKACNWESVEELERIIYQTTHQNERTEVYYPAVFDAPYNYFRDTCCTTGLDRWKRKRGIYVSNNNWMFFCLYKNSCLCNLFLLS